MSTVLAYILPDIKIYKEKQNSLSPLYLYNPKKVTALDTPGHQWSKEECSFPCVQPDSVQLSCHLLGAAGGRI